jgi:hypothetical protein
VAGKQGTFSGAASDMRIAELPVLLLALFVTGAKAAAEATRLKSERQASFMMLNDIY